MSLISFRLETAIIEGLMRFQIVWLYHIVQILLQFVYQNDKNPCP